MAKTVTAEVSLGFVYSPLVISSGIEVVGNVPAIQQFDIGSNTYTPDYTQTHLVLRPWLDVADPDGVLTPSDIVWANMAWTVVEGGVETAISAGSTYGLASDGTLTVKRNIDPDNPATFRFEGDFLDPRTGEIHSVVESALVFAESVSVRPQLLLDAPAAFRYDPIRDTVSTRKVTARLVQGDADVPAANVEFVWQKKDADGTWADILPDTDPDRDIMDYDVSLNAAKTELTVDCALVGKRIDVRVYAKHNPFGDPSGIPIDASTPTQEFSVVRYEPKFNENTRILMASHIHPSQKQVKPIVDVRDQKGNVDDPESVVDIEWYMSKGTAAGSVAYGPCLGTGTNPTIPSSAVVKTYGAKIGVFCKAKAPLKALTVDGKVLTYNGKVLLGR